MPVNLPGNAASFPANITGPAPLDVAAGTEIGAVMGSQLADRTAWLRQKGSNIIFDFDMVSQADASSAYAAFDSTTLTAWDFLGLQINLAAEVGDLLIAVAQVTGVYTGANFGEMRLADKSNSIVSPHARWSTTTVRETRTIVLYQEVANASGRSIDLEGQVKTAGTIEAQGSAVLWGVVLRKMAP